MGRHRQAPNTMTRPSARSRTSIEHPEDGVQHPLPNRASPASRSISATTLDDAHSKLVPSSWLPCLDSRGRWRTRRSEEHTSELQSLMRISYAVFCLKKKKNTLRQKNP